MSDAVIYLASASPRRRELLDQIGVRQELLVGAVDERRRAGEVPELYVARMALEKARAGCARRPAGDRRAALGADTTVVSGEIVRGKRRDRAVGLVMLRLLAGCTHIFF